MIEVNDIILKVRSRIKDEDYSDLRFSEGELIDCINSICLDLVLELKLNKAKVEKVLNLEDTHIYIDNLLSVFEAKFNGNYINKRTDMEKDSGELELLIDEKGISITPPRCGLLTITYNHFEKAQDLSDTLPLPTIATDCIVYGVICKLLEVYTSEANFNKIALFSQLYQSAKDSIIAHINALYTSPRLQSKVVRI